MTTFSGFADAGAKFWKGLAKNNDRAWFAAHKADFEDGWNTPMKLLLADVHGVIDKHYPHLDLGEPKVFRIFRDVRFSKDKSPYKTHIGGFIPLERRSAKVTDKPMALYFHVGATEIIAAAGHYMMEPESVGRYRAAVADDARGKELTKLLAALARSGFRPGPHEAFKRVPKGYEPEHPRAELLKQKGLTVTFPEVPRALLTSKALVKWLADGCKKTAKLVEWLAFATA